VQEGQTGRRITLPFCHFLPTLLRLLNLSTHFEQQLMKRTNQKNLSISSTVQEDFEVALQQNKFCELDTHKRLTHPNATTLRAVELTVSLSLQNKDFGLQRNYLNLTK
jgi:hypothetical protein